MLCIGVLDIPHRPVQPVQRSHFRVGLAAFGPAARAQTAWMARPRRALNARIDHREKLLNAGLGIVEQKRGIARPLEERLVSLAVLSVRVASDIMQDKASCGAPGARFVSTPLLQTKLHVPFLRSETLDAGPPSALRARWVSRPRLVERLDAGLGAGNKLTLVSAPAGYGKTTLLAEWIAQCELRARLAWVSLDRGDNDPARFWAYVAAALQGVQEELGESLQAAFQSPQTPPIESALAGLLNRVAELREPIVLVLDDYHAIRGAGPASTAIHDAVAFLLENMPPQMHLVLATRVDPPLPIPRLRGRGQMIGLYQSDLAFTSEEIAHFLDLALGVELSAQELTVLERRTEGWIAGLQMAALSMRGRDDLSGFVRAFAGSHRYILDYLGEEVLRQQDDGVQAFLLQTSILDRLCGERASNLRGTFDRPDHDLPCLVLHEPHSTWRADVELLAELLRDRRLSFARDGDCGPLLRVRHA